jgi:hypothetical protein
MGGAFNTRHYFHHKRQQFIRSFQLSRRRIYWVIQRPVILFRYDKEIPTIAAVTKKLAKKLKAKDTLFIFNNFWINMRPEYKFEKGTVPILNVYSWYARSE